MFCKLGFHSICTLARTKPNPALMMDHDLHAQTLIFHYLLHTCFITHLMDDIPRFIDDQHLRIDLFSRLISSALFIHTFHDLLSSTGWRRCIGCLNSQVSFRKRATNHRALLQKMTYEDKASYDSTPTCSMHSRCADAAEMCKDRDLHVYMPYMYICPVCMYGLSR